MSCKLILTLMWLGFAVTTGEREWTNLKVHFGVNPFSKYTYQKMPRSLSEMDTNDWINISGDDCTNGGRYNGFRYMGVGETGMALLFDIQGTIAGIQQILNKEELLSDSNNHFRYDKVPQFNCDTLNEEDVYVITAYFVDPSTICTTGRPSSDLSVNGTGTLLRIQGNGTSDILEMPRKRADAIAEGWSKNQCFVGMGYHNFYKVEEMAATDCMEVVPFFGLYDNNGDQLGFGFSSYGHSNSNYFEHPPATAVKMIVGPTVPDCLLDSAKSPGLSTMHVFFNNYPNFYACIL